jgi:hypothetical protein
VVSTRFRRPRRCRPSPSLSTPHGCRPSLEGKAATAGRALNQQKIVICQEMARSITGGNEAKAAQVVADAAAAKIQRAADLIERNKSLVAENEAAVAAAQKITQDARHSSVADQTRFRRRMTTLRPITTRCRWTRREPAWLGARRKWPRWLPNGQRR